MSSRFDNDGVASDGVEATDFVAGAALDALRRVQVVRLGPGTGDGAGRAHLHAALAARTFSGDNSIDNQVLAGHCRAAVVLDVSDELGPEILEGSQCRVGS